VILACGPKRRLAVAPLVSTQFSQMPRRWSYHYIISCGLSLFTFTVLAIVFKGKRQEVLLAESGVDCPTLIGVGDDEKDDRKGTTAEVSSYRAMFSQVVLHFLAIFILLYVGVELTVGGTFSVLAAVARLIVTFSLANHIHNSRARWRFKLGVHHNWFLRRIGTWPCHSATPQRKSEFQPGPCIKKANLALSLANNLQYSSTAH